MTGNVVSMIIVIDDEDVDVPTVFVAVAVIA